MVSIFLALVISVTVLPLLRKGVPVLLNRSPGEHQCCRSSALRMCARVMVVTVVVIMIRSHHDHVHAG